MILNIFIWCWLVFMQERSRSNLLFVFMISQISVIFLQVILLSRITCASSSCCSCWVAFLNMLAAFLLWSFLLLFSEIFFFYLYHFWKKGDLTVFSTHCSVWGWVMVFCSSTVMFSVLFFIYFLMFSNVWLAFVTAIKHQVDIFVGLSVITPDLSPK